jgi:hypothetical protein
VKFGFKIVTKAIIQKGSAGSAVGVERSYAVDLMFGGSYMHCVDFHFVVLGIKFYISPSQFQTSQRHRL